MVFRRPELEKDNPIAIQPYVGPRRRRVQAKAVPVGESAEIGDMRAVLQTLIEAAAQVEKGLSKTKTKAKGLIALRHAITQAERALKEC